MSTIAATLQSFFTERLTTQRQVSEHTIASYRDTCRLLLEFMQRPTSGEIVYVHGPKIYDLSLTTNTTRLVRALRPLRKHNEPLHDEVFLAGISSDGRVALIEFVDFGGRHDLVHDYRLDLDTGAITRIHLVTTDPAQIHLS